MNTETPVLAVRSSSFQSSPSLTNLSREMVVNVRGFQNLLPSLSSNGSTSASSTFADLIALAGFLSIHSESTRELRRVLQRWSGRSALLTFRKRALVLTIWYEILVVAQTGVGLTGNSLVFLVFVHKRGLSL